MRCQRTEVPYIPYYLLSSSSISSSYSSSVTLCFRPASMLVSEPNLTHLDLLHVAASSPMPSVALVARRLDKPLIEPIPLGFPSSSPHPMKTLPTFAYYANQSVVAAVGFTSSLFLLLLLLSFSIFLSYSLSFRFLIENEKGITFFFFLLFREPLRGTSLGEFELTRAS